MAANSWNSLVGSVNQAISSMGTATSSANGAAAAATEARETAERNAALAQTAAQNAQGAADSADAERAKWTGAVASATTLDPEAEATFSITEKDGVTGSNWPWMYDEQGTMYAVYDFLERFAGCRFYFPGELGTILPRTEV